MAAAAAAAAEAAVTTVMVVAAAVADTGAGGAAMIATAATGAFLWRAVRKMCIQSSRFRGVCIGDQVFSCKVVNFGYKVT